MTDSKDPLALGAMHLANRLSIATAGPDKGVPFPEAQGFEPDPSACGTARPSEVFDYLEAAAGRLPAFQWPLPLWPDDVAHLDNDHNRKYAPHLLVADDPIRLRIVMERAVVRAAAAQLIADGWLVRVYYGDSQHGGGESTADGKHELALRNTARGRIRHTLPGLDCFARCFCDRLGHSRADHALCCAGRGFKRELVFGKKLLCLLRDLVGNIPVQDLVMTEGQQHAPDRVMFGKAEQIPNLVELRDFFGGRRPTDQRLKRQVQWARVRLWCHVLVQK